MALITCPECGKEISNTADHCIHCGYKINNSNEPNSSSPSNDSDNNIPKPNEYMKTVVGEWLATDKKSKKIIDESAWGCFLSILIHLPFVALEILFIIFLFITGEFALLYAAVIVGIIHSIVSYGMNAVDSRKRDKIPLRFSQYIQRNNINIIELLKKNLHPEFIHINEDNHTAIGYALETIVYEKTNRVRKKYKIARYVLSTVSEISYSIAGLMIPNAIQFIINTEGAEFTKYQTCFIITFIVIVTVATVCSTIYSRLKPKMVKEIEKAKEEWLATNLPEAAKYFDDIKHGFSFHIDWSTD